MLIIRELDVYQLPPSEVTLILYHNCSRCVTDIPWCQPQVCNNNPDRRGSTGSPDDRGPNNMDGHQVVSLQEERKGAL